MPVDPRPRHRPPRVAPALLFALGACTSTPLPPDVPAAPAAPLPASAASAVTAASAASAAVPAASAASGAPADPDAERRFALWVAAFREQARAKGIDDATLAAAFDGVTYRPRVVDQDRSQPEFTRSVWDYLEGIVSAKRVAAGQDKLQQVRAEADAAASTYGVSAPVLVAIWGIESNYGANYGDVPAIDALATLGFEGRREDWARGELMAALRILQRGEIDRAQLVGSWAGAMGQTQFLPSVYLANAVDADGDGRRDIWTSMADVLASTARFVARSGWRASEPWGLEVALPTGFDVGRADASVRQSSDAWGAEGVKAVDGTPLPAMSDAAVLLPAGAHGPAFLVGDNFRALLRYNNSTSYALAVGLLSQRIAGGPAVQAAWPRDLPPLSRTQLLALQAALNQRGFDCGSPDGLLGPATRGALRGYQRSIGVPADGYPTLELLQRLQAP